jgi:hypothetical protein
VEQGGHGANLSHSANCPDEGLWETLLRLGPRNTLTSGPQRSELAKKKINDINSLASLFLTSYSNVPSLHVEALWRGCVALPFLFFDLFGNFFRACPQVSYVGHAPNFKIWNAHLLTNGLVPQSQNLINIRV